MYSRLDGKTKNIEITTLADVRFAFRYNNSHVAKELKMNRGTCHRASDDVLVIVYRDSNGNINGLEPMKSMQMEK